MAKHKCVINLLSLFQLFFSTFYPANLSFSDVQNQNKLHTHCIIMYFFSSWEKDKGYLEVGL